MYKIFVQSDLLPDISLIELAPDTTPTTLKSKLYSLISDVECSNISVFLEDSDEEDSLSSLDQITDGLRFHLNRLKSIDVSVHYAGRCVKRTFRPGATILKVKHWASRELGIDRSDAVDLSLQLSGTDKRPDVDIHIGCLVEYPCMDLDFDLVPSPRING